MWLRNVASARELEWAVADEAVLIRELTGQQQQMAADVR
jgi:hypothetical protein